MSPDKDGYPTEDELKKIQKLKDYTKLLEHLESIWHWSEWGFVKRWGFVTFPKRKKVLKLELHTGGWSGNEDIIQRLTETDFWLLFWVRSDRGGHFYFEIPNKTLKGGN